MSTWIDSALNRKEAGFFEMLEINYPTRRCHNPEDQVLWQSLGENPKSWFVYYWDYFVFHIYCVVFMRSWVSANETIEVVINGRKSLLKIKGKWERYYDNIVRAKNSKNMTVFIAGSLWCSPSAQNGRQYRRILLLYIVCRIHLYLLFLVTAVVPHLLCEGTVFDSKIVYHLVSLPSDRWRTKWNCFML